MPDDLESYAPQSTEPGSSTSMTQNEASGLGDASSAPSATYLPANDTFFPIDFDLIDDHTTFQNPQQLDFDAVDILPQLDEAAFAQNLPVSGADNDNILHEVGEVAAAALMHSYADYPPTNGSMVTQNPQISGVAAASIPPGLQYVVPTTSSMGISFLSEALDPMLFAMWPLGGGQPMHRYTGRISRIPSREEVVTFIEGLEKVDLERLESDSRECGICRAQNQMVGDMSYVRFAEF
ncbi:hypothetical protein G7Y79_00031g066380 [Physcia stellaris]|nr:hypothetical protein G7Y79_00031g066380 [Physcia stellaris]